MSTPETNAVLPKLEEVVRAIEAAKRLNLSAQNQQRVGTDTWHVHEQIDDKLHEALQHLTG